MTRRMNGTRTTMAKVSPKVVEAKAKGKDQENQPMVAPFAAALGIKQPIAQALPKANAVRAVVAENVKADEKANEADALLAADTSLTARTKTKHGMKTKPNRTTGKVGVGVVQ